MCVYIDRNQFKLYLIYVQSHRKTQWWIISEWDEAEITPYHIYFN